MNFILYLVYIFTDFLITMIWGNYFFFFFWETNLTSIWLIKNICINRMTIMNFFKYFIEIMAYLGKSNLILSFSKLKSKLFNFILI